MAEYIEREAAIQAVEKTLWQYQQSVIEIRKVPAADVIPVRHGRWIAPFLSGGGSICAECSYCHKIRIIDDYCSACGTIMDLEDMED